MRRLLLLLTALILGLWAGQILRDLDLPRAIALRDGLLLAAVAGAIYAFNAGRTPVLPVRLRAAADPLLARMVGLAGVGCAAVAGWLLFLRVGSAGWEASLLGPVLWLAGLLLFTISLFWPDPGRRDGASARWDVETARRFVRRTLAHRAETKTDPFYLSARSILLGLLLVVAVAAGLRLWHLTDLPSGCSDAECAAGLQALQWLHAPSFAAFLAGGAPLFHALVAAFLALFPTGITSLQLVGALLGIATIPALYVAISRFTTAATALLAAMLLALSPWHVAASRSAQPQQLLVFWLLLAIWALFRAKENGARRWWGLAGICAGLALSAAPISPLWLLLALWWLLVPWPAAPLNVLTLYAGTFVVAVPVLVRLPASGELSALQPGLWLSRLGAMVELLWRGGDAPPLLDPLAAILILLGVAVALRYLRSFPARLSLGGVLFVVVGLLWQDTPLSAVALLPLLPFLYLCAGGAIEQLVGHFAQVWWPVLRPAVMLAGMALLLMLATGGSAVRALDRWTTPDFVDEHNVAEVELGRYLAHLLSPDSGLQPGAEEPANRAETAGGAEAGLADEQILVPPAILARPALQLAAGPALANQRIAPLDVTRHLPFFSPVPTPVRYIVPADDPDLLALLRQIYPGVSVQEVRHEPSGRLLFTVYPVSKALVQDVQGLPGLYFAGRTRGTPADAQMVRKDGPLAFDWQESPPLDLPFTVVWQGFLRVPRFGSYTFEALSGTAHFVLFVDDEPVLDTAQQQTTGVVDLAAGLYPLRMEYDSGETPQDLTVRWQEAGASWQVLARPYLYAVPLPETGLLATYYAGDSFTGDVVNRRRELLLWPSPDPSAYGSVVWQGKLAAPLPGEYRLAVATEGDIQVSVNGQPVLASGDPATEKIAETGTASSVGLTTSDGVVLLDRGWYDLVLRYRPHGQTPQVRLIWQPPGRAQSPIPVGFLRPLLPDVSTEALAIPELPMPLVLPSPAAENGTPAPSPALRAPETSSLPAGLAPLPLEKQWQVGAGCGAGDEQFAQPRGVALDPLVGRVYVADAGNRRVALRNLADGAPAGLYTSQRFQEPFDVSTSIVGELFLLDAVSQQIYHIVQPSGSVEILPVNTAFYRPRGLGLNLTGNLFVADTGGARVVMLQPSGEVITQFGGQRSPLGSGQPVDVIAQPNQAIWVVSAQDGRLWRLDTGQGQTATMPTNTFDAPHLAGLSNSTFFLTDPERQIVLYYSASGQPVGQFGGPDIFAKPVGIGAALYEGQVYVAVSDSVTCQVSLWTAPQEALQP